MKLSFADEAIDKSLRKDKIMKKLSKQVKSRNKDNDDIRIKKSLERLKKDYKSSDDISYEKLLDNKREETEARNNDRDAYAKNFWQWLAIIIIGVIVLPIYILSVKWSIGEFIFTTTLYCAWIVLIIYKVENRE